MKLYTKTICPKCLWVKSELQAANLDVEMINIDHDDSAKEAVINAGFMTVPVLEVNGEWFADTASIIAQIEKMALV